MRYLRRKSLNEVNPMSAEPKYYLGRVAADSDWAFSDASLPYFHKGNEIGCLVQHGFSGTPANMRTVFEPLADAGFTVIAPLLSGHRTTIRDMERFGRSDWRGNVRAAYDRLAGEGCRKIFAVGLSMGGLLSADLAAECRLDGLVLMSTPFRMQPYLNAGSLLYPFVKYIMLPTELPREPDKELYNGLSTKSLAELRRLTREVRAKLPRITCPTLMIQSRLDNRVKLSSVPKAQLAIPTKPELIWLEHSPHGCTYGPESSLAGKLTLRFINEHSGIDNPSASDL